MHDNLVIGSGPSAVSAAYALAGKGERVTVVDAGYSLETERRNRVALLAERDPGDWGDEAAIFYENVEFGAGGVKEKKLFGSDFASRASQAFRIERENAVFCTSLARGGLSNIWGRGVEPAAREDLAHWPVSYDRLREYYAKVLEFMPLSADRDGLLACYPLFTDSFNRPPLSAQARVLAGQFRKNEKALGERGIYGGVSRIAASYSGGSRECTRCGKCLAGCPYGLLYSSSDTLARLCAEGSVTYLPGFLADSIEERRDAVTVRCIEGKNNSPVSFRAKRVFLAAGPISSAKILLKSLERFGEELVIRNSDMLYIPALLRNPPANVVSEDKITMSLFSLALADASVSSHPVGMHCYLNNEMFLHILNNAAGPFKAVAQPLIRAFLNRFFMIFAFVHSSESSHLSAVLEKETDILHVTGVKPAAAQQVNRRIRKKLFAHRGLTGFYPVPLYRDKNLPGSSIHSGASFPMGKSADTLGRPDGFKNLHVVDATVLPDIPSGSFTFTVMANAYRIAEEAAGG